MKMMNACIAWESTAKMRETGNTNYFTVSEMVKVLRIDKLGFGLSRASAID